MYDYKDAWHKDFRSKDKALAFAQEKVGACRNVWVVTESKDPLFQCEELFNYAAPAGTA